VWCVCGVCGCVCVCGCERVRACGVVRVSVVCVGARACVCGACVRVRECVVCARARVCVAKKKQFYVRQSIYVTDVVTNFCSLQSLNGVRTYHCRMINKPLLGSSQVKQCYSLTSHY